MTKPHRDRRRPRAGGSKEKKNMSSGRNGVENGGCGSISWNFSSLSRRKISRAGRRLISREANGILRLIGELKWSIGRG